MKKRILTYLILLLITMQSVSVRADIHDLYQTESRHAVMDDSAAVMDDSTHRTLDDSFALFDEQLTHWACDSGDCDNCSDCYSHCHSHCVQAILLSAFNFAFQKSLPAVTAYRADVLPTPISPLLRPPIA